jgi:hypothetical protein
MSGKPVEDRLEPRAHLVEPVHRRRERLSERDGWREHLREPVERRQGPEPSEAIDELAWALHRATRVPRGSSRRKRRARD